MKIYAVGGAVRDALLGLAVKDRDWVVVGASPEEMLAQGFRAVGKDFPVFLHPHSHEEYALARTERKTAPGYAGFSFHAAPDVTLEDDLMRRDLTINAIAQDEDGNLIDPYHGQEDLAARVLRHVSPAFAEDPVRILRVARFMARFADFRVAPETMDLMRSITAAGEVDALVSERVWQEISNGLMATKPSRMFETLRECGALSRLLPELDALWGVPQRADYHPEIDTGVHMMMVLDMAARLQAPLPARFAALTHDLGKATTPKDILPRHHGHEQRSVDLLMAVCDRWRVPTECRDVARLTARYHGNLHNYAELRHGTRLEILERCDALRRPERFDLVLQACEADYRGRLGWSEREYTQSAAWKGDRDIVRTVDAGAVAATINDAAKVPDAIRAARLRALVVALP